MCTVHSSVNISCVDGQSCNMLHYIMGRLREERICWCHPWIELLSGKSISKQSVHIIYYDLSKYPLQYRDIPAHTPFFCPSSGGSRREIQAVSLPCSQFWKWQGNEDAIVIFIRNVYGYLYGNMDSWLNPLKNPAASHIEGPYHYCSCCYHYCSIVLSSELRKSPLSKWGGRSTRYT